MIRPLLRPDREPVLDLLRVTGNFTGAELEIAAELMDVVLGQPAQRDYHAFVDATGNGSDVAVAGFLLIGPTPATVGTWDLYWMAVHPRHYGTGIAQHLDSFAERFVRAQGGYWLIAETSSQAGYERVRAFYRKQQYDILARIPDYYMLDDDLIVFGKRLTAARGET
jgi:ribosomal protein S18 acetylase RimI-like enzyme